eukprot:CAMPEP_0194288778 /NCGR_PEP_ID=MMETSP0169-20130528/37609_1 /TAXON_ID=218684 /ORGANISM="Corethron pennatum, Strain L29A3" /LENGTH=129 /DNA_ID=CAMNT_0039035879 /DNA_START=1 /DNA_END=387 /DNA_ORIENTATION=+
MMPDFSVPATAAELLRRKKREERFQTSTGDAGDGDDGSSSEEEGPSFVGRQQELLRPFLRLTSAPDPARVRPPTVLRRSLALVKYTYRRMAQAESERRAGGEGWEEKELRALLATPGHADLGPAAWYDW